ncbi:hypothetical protein Sjap_004580 [Stephania japonica]|uniref:Uncharacterized protein n=1 Tax=Stephania japonica TaxID=461633 RepID=A0AAP0K4P5_9MAGN
MNLDEGMNRWVVFVGDEELLRPTSLPKVLLDTTLSTNIYKKATLQQINCPHGTVPIKRVGKEELRATKHFAESLSSRPNEISPQSKFPGTYQAVAKLGNGGYRGVRSSISLQKLEIATNQQMRVKCGFRTI